MTLFHFEAIAATGQTIEGVIEADSLPSALSLLRQRGVNPYRAEPASSALQQKPNPRGSAFQSLGLEWRARTIRQIATLLAAGITLDRALKILGSQAKKSPEKTFVDGVLDKVSSGQSFSTSVANMSSQFKADEIGLIRAGEQSGSLVTVLEELATLLERRLQLRGRLASALIYPAFLLALAPISLIIIATILVPNIAPLFENSEATVPFALRAMIWVSEGFRVHGAIWLLGLFGLLLATYFAFRNRAMRSRLRVLLNVLPMARVITKRSDASRICRTLGSLLRSGAPLQTALSAVTDVTTDKFTRDRLGSAKDAVSGGEKLAKALGTVPALDSTALQMIAIGEETNKLDTMLLFVADTEEKALANYIDRLMTLLTPLLTVAMGLFVGGIVMSIMRAILSVNELAAR
jgi:general secretion pathway protein F